MVSLGVYGFVTVMPRLVTGILAIAYARAFSPEEYANYGILAAMIALLSLIVDFGTPDVVMRNFHAAGKSSTRYIPAVIFGGRILMLAILPVAGTILYLSWEYLGLRFSQAWLFVPALMLIAFFDRAAETLATVCRASEHPLYFAAGRATQGITMIVVGSVLVLVFRLGVGGAVLAMVLATIVSFATYEFIVTRRLGISGHRLDWQVTKASLVFGLPIAPNRVATWARQLALRPALTQVVSMSSVGLFSFASSVAVIPSLLSAAVDLALGPIYFKQREGQEPLVFGAKLFDFATIYIAGLLPIWVIAIAFSPEIILFLAGRPYVAAAPACAVLLCANFVWMHVPFMNRQIHFLRKTWALPMITLPFATFGVVVSVLLARDFGIIAAAWTVLGVDTGILIALACVVRHYEPIQYPIALALSFVATLAGLAAWVVGGEPVPIDWSPMLVKVLIVCVASTASMSIWVWPNRLLILHLAKG